MARMTRAVLLLAVAVAAVSGKSLTKDNYEEHSAGKSVFIKFQAPWCSALPNMLLERCVVLARRHVMTLCC